MNLSSEMRSLLRPVGRMIDGLPKPVFSRTGQFVVDLVLAIASVLVAFAVRFDGNVPVFYKPVMWALILVVPVLRASAVDALGGHRIVWRYFALHDELALIASALPVTMLIAIARYTFPTQKYWFALVPAGVILIEFAAFVLLASGVRVFRRVTNEATGDASSVTRALVIGTGETLAAAVRHLAGYTSIRVVGLLATEDYLLGNVIGGFPVIGSAEDLRRLLAANAADVVLVSDAGLGCLGEAVETATLFDKEIRLLPSAANILHGSVRVSALVSPERAVGRRTIDSATAHPAVMDAYRDRCVLVTGAGGSIGSEMCRQVSRLPVAGLILLDRDENSIFEIGGELSATAGGKIVPIVGDIRDAYAMDRLFEKYRPHIVLHAAAYKHVPVMEQNCSEAVLNNVVGTRQIAERAFEFASERLLMISTDKAVHPTSVMGATKRIAEQLVQLMGNAQGEKQTRCSCVRFGNVVGSRGSVVPIFLRQIAAGGPITITDENMTRYFMTIPEAVQLVLQASTLGSAGDIYMLDMGDPVKIATMARKLIEMSGLRPDKDIATRIVGARPGEKLHEQLFGEDAETQATSVDRVFRVRVPIVNPPDFYSRLNSLEEAARLRDDTLVRQCLHEMPIDFRQSRAASVGSNEAN